MPDRGRTSLLKLGSVFLVLLALTGALGATALASEGHVVEAASGRYAGRGWTFGLVGHRGERCAVLSTFGRTEGDETMVCGADETVHGPWSESFGDSAPNDASTISVNLTSPRVFALRLLLGHPGPDAHAPTWRYLHTRALTEEQMEEAGLEGRFRFVVLTGIGNLCVLKVRAFDVEGHRLARFNLPCEY
jgi:hypothetical protein